MCIFNQSHLGPEIGSEFIIPLADEKRLTGLLESIIIYPFKPRLFKISACNSGPAFDKETSVSLPKQSTYCLNLLPSISPNCEAFLISSSLIYLSLSKSRTAFSFSNLSLAYSRIFLALAFNSDIWTWAWPSISNC